MRTFCLTTLALFAFAGNSVLCRLALAEPLIDATSFTVVRLLSGVIVLYLLVFIAGHNKQGGNTSSSGSLYQKTTWLPAICLFIYATTFSFAYIQLDTGTGALILFAAVQISMLLYAIYSGERLNKTAVVGFLLAVAGFAYLVSPNLTSPSLIGFILMTISGIAWAAYTLLGKGANNPLIDTANNFIKTLPLISLLTILVYLFAHDSINISSTGLILAITSGAVTSAIGYAIWYAALKNLTATNAAVLQLLVPVIAAIGGIIFANETLTLEFLLASAMLLGGILLVVTSEQNRA
ncbi:DMT family transporter [Catenovulum sp. SX2]|uniref:DMT family transporter n=1 Tax=Catenovulum sp. SX2 TaxID=3398614 RepID=UPI003F86A8A4